MPLATDVEGWPLHGAKGVELGVVSRVLFHPSEARAVGVMVRPPSRLYVIERAETYLPLDAVAFAEGGGARSTLAKLPSVHAGADGLGFDPDLTVIWMGMNVRGPSETLIGHVNDVDFDASTGAVRRMAIAAGAVADAAHGRYVVPGTLVEGYREGAVRIGAEAAELVTSGGLAKTAAEAVVAAGEVARSAGAAIESGVVDASGATGRAIRKAADSQVVEKAAKSVAKTARTTWKDSVKAFRDGMHGDD